MGGWKAVALGDVCEILDRLRKPITKKNRLFGPYPYYGATGVLDYVDGYLFDELLVLVGEDGAKWGAGDDTAFAVQGKCWVNNHAHVIRPSREILSDSWLIYYLNHTNLTSFISGITVPKLNQAKLRAIPIPLPSLPEQQRIISILDESFAAIDTAIANTEKNLANAQELFESQLNVLLSTEHAVVEGWNHLKIRDIVEPLTTVDPRKTPDDVFVYIDVSSVSRQTFLIEGFSTILGGDAPSRARRLVKTGDVIFATIRPTLQRIAEIPKAFDGAVCSTGYFVLRPKSMVLSRYLFHYLFSHQFYSEMETLQRGTSYPAVSDRDVKEHQILLPLLPEQERIISILDETSSLTMNLKSNYNRKLNALSELKQSILHQAFTGQLTNTPTESLKAAGL